MFLLVRVSRTLMGRVPFGLIIRPIRGGGGQLNGCMMQDTGCKIKDRFLALFETAR
jgi:hypothetical protein